MGRKIQRLRRQVTHRVIKGMRSMSRTVQYAGFSTVPDSDPEIDNGAAASSTDDPKLRHMQLHNTIVRALLVVPVTYEPSRLLRRSKDAVMVVTGADLVVVKMCKMVVVNCAASDSQKVQIPPSRHSSMGDRDVTASAADTEPWTTESGAATAADLAQACVLAQHELNKMVKCCVNGKQLELEFIVTGGARFKVSAGALGFSSGSQDPECLDIPQPAYTRVEDTVRTGSAPVAMLAEMEGNSPSPQQTGAAASASLSGSEAAVVATHGNSAESSVQTAANTNASLCAEPNATGTMHAAAEQPQQVAAALAGSSCASINTSACRRVSLATESEDTKIDAKNNKLTPSGSRQAMNSSSIAAGSAASSGGAAGAIKQGIGRSASYVRNLGSSVASYVPSFEDASRSVSGSIRSFKLVKTDEGSYWVGVESFTLQFRDALTCELAAGLLQSGRANMRAAVEWLKQGLPFKPEFSITHITELSNRAGPEALVSGPTGWETDLQLPGSWEQAINTAQLPQEQPLLTPIHVADGPAAFRIHLATPSGLAQATVVPELLALLAQHPHPRGQLLAVPVHLQSEQSATIQRQQGEQQQQQSQQDQLELLQHSRGQPEAGLTAGHASSLQQADLLQLQQHSAAPDAAAVHHVEQRQQGLHTLEVNGLVGSSDELDIVDGDGDLYDDDDSDIFNSCATFTTAHGDGPNFDASGLVASQHADLQPPVLPVLPLSHTGLTHAAVATNQGPKTNTDTTLEGDTTVDDLSVSSSKLRRILNMSTRPYTLTKSVARGLLSKVVTSKASGLSSIPPGSEGRSNIMRLVGSPVASLGMSLTSSTLRRLGVGQSFDGGADRPSARVLRRSKSQPARLSSFRATLDSARSDKLQDPTEGNDNQIAKFRRAASSEDLLHLQQQASHEQPAQSRAGVIRQRPWFERGQASFQRRSVPSSCYSSTESSSSQCFTQSLTARLQPQHQHPSQQNEIYAVLHVQLVSGSSTSCSSATVSTNMSNPAFTGHVAAAGTQAEAAGTASPVTASHHMHDGQPPLLGSARGMVRLGAAHTDAFHQVTPSDQRLLSLTVAAAAVLCILSLLWHSTSGAALAVFAVALNTVCVLLTAHPSLMHGGIQHWVQKLQLGGKPLAAAETPGCSSLAEHLSPDRQAEHGTEVIQQMSAISSVVTGFAPTTAAAAPSAAHRTSALQLRLMGASFVSAPLGMLQEQISAFKILQERTYEELAGFTSDPGLPADSGLDVEAADDIDNLPGVGLQPDDVEDGNRLVLLSSPEPSWLTPDWRRRILAARQTIDERRKLASYVHTWRVQHHADRLLLKQPPHFEWFQKHMQLTPLVVTPQGHVVLLLKMASLVQLSRNLAASDVTLHDFSVYCGFIWQYMFEVLAPGSHPSGRLIMVSDMKDVKLGQAVGEGQVGARALGAVCNAWPERLVSCLVLGTPSWFNMLYRLVRPHLSPSTSAKIQICDAVEGAAELALWLGPGMVPREYGGPCSLHYDEYPAQKQLLEYVRKLPMK